MRLAEYSLSYERVLRCKESSAHLAMRERVFLYSIVFSLAPQWSLEIGTFKGGSAYIISGALDDVALGGKLVTIDPYPEQIELNWSTIAHNTKSVQGFFPKDIEKVVLPDGIRYDFAFVDGDHSYNAVLNDLTSLPEILSKEAYVLLHDAYNAEVNAAIQEAQKKSRYQDCGRIGRVMNDICGDELYGGFHLLLNK